MPKSCPKEGSSTIMHRIQWSQPSVCVFTEPLLVVYLFNAIHTLQELIGQGVQPEKIHSIEGTLQQLQDGGQLQESSRLWQLNPSKTQNKLRLFAHEMIGSKCKSKSQLIHISLFL